VKICFKCGESKPISDFYKHPAMADGHLGKCKECTKKDVHKTRLDSIDYYRDYDNKRSKLPHRKKLNKSIVTNYRAKHPDRYKAHNAVANAVRDGRLIKPDYCSRCGRSDKVIHAHHRDYSKPLDVEWLCVLCHSAERGRPEQKETVYQQPIFIQMELFEQQTSCSY